MMLTAQLRSIIEIYREQLTESEFTSLEAEIYRILDHYTVLLSKEKPGVGRGRLVHQLIEEQLLANESIKTSCQKGCGACCHLEVEILADDAEVIADSLVFGPQIDFKQLQNQASRKRLDPEWSKGVVSTNRCVFLGPDNACQNYSNRPSVCRKHSVITPKEDCETLGSSPKPRVIPMNEIILSAAMNQPGNDFGSLPKLLHRSLEKRNWIFEQANFSDQEKELK